MRSINEQDGMTAHWSATGGFGAPATASVRIASLLAAHDLPRAAFRSRRGSHRRTRVRTSGDFAVAVEVIDGIGEAKPDQCVTQCDPLVYEVENTAVADVCRRT
jgi:hypothetical protein